MCLRVWSFKIQGARVIYSPTSPNLSLHTSPGPPPGDRQGGGEQDRSGRVSGILAWLNGLRLHFCVGSRVFMALDVGTWDW